MTQFRQAQTRSLDRGYFELRISLCNPVKFNELVGTNSCDLQSLHCKHQVKPIATWRSVPAEPRPFLASLFHWSSLDHRHDVVRSCRAAASRLGCEKRHGNSLIRETDVSILKCADEWPVSLPNVDLQMTEALYELRHYRLGVGGNEVGFAFLSNPVMRFMVNHGATVIALFRMWLGDLPQAVALLSWPDYMSRAEAFKAYDNNKELQDVHESQRAQFGATVVGRVHCYLLQAPSIRCDDSAA